MYFCGHWINAKKAAVKTFQIKTFTNLVFSLTDTNSSFPMAYSATTQVLSLMLIVINIRIYLNICKQFGTNIWIELPGNHQGIVIDVDHDKKTGYIQMFNRWRCNNSRIFIDVDHNEWKHWRCWHIWIEVLSNNPCVISGVDKHNQRMFFSKHFNQEEVKMRFDIVLNINTYFLLMTNIKQGRLGTWVRSII